MKSISALKITGIGLSMVALVGLCAISGCKRKSPSSKPSDDTSPPTAPPAPPPETPATDKTKEFTVGVLYWSMNIPGQVAMRQGLEAEADRINRTRGDKPGVKLIVHVAGDGEEGMERQVKRMDEFIEMKLDLIIVQPTDIAALGHPLQKANQAGIPVVAYDQYIIGGKLACYITSNNYQAGYLDGEYIASKFPDDQKIRIILVEYPHVSSTVRRVDGFMDALQASEQSYEILKSYYAVEPESGRIAGQQILSDFPEKGSIDVVFTVNDGGGLPIINALTKAGRTEILGATIDGDPDSVEIIKNNGITVIDSAQFCGIMGAEAMKAAYKILLGQEVPNHQLVPVFPITRETLDKYKGWMGPVPSRFKKPWKSKVPYWEGTMEIVSPNDSN